MEDSVENEKMIQTLQNFYIAAIADASLQFTKEGVLQSVEKRKKVMQITNAPNMIKSLEITNTEDAFIKLRN